MASKDETHEILYFDGPGRAETLRIMLHAAGIDFKDTRFTRSEWPKLKPTTPLGSVPVLTIGGDRKYCQSTALQRYGAKLAGFYPSDPIEALVVDEVTDTLNEVSSKMPFGGPEDLKVRRTKFQEDVMNPYIQFLESKIQNSGGEGGCGFAPSGITVADVALMGTVKMVQSGNLDHIDTKCFDDCPGILATCEAAQTNPKVMAYYESLKK